MTKRNSSLLAVVNSKRRKENREIENSFRILEGKRILTNAESNKDRKASKEKPFNLLGGMGVSNDIIKLTFNATGISEEYDDLMSRTVAKESRNMDILDMYIDRYTITKGYAREAIINFIDRHVHIEENDNLPFSIIFDHDAYEEKKRSSYIYGDEADMVMTIIKSIPEMFHHLKYESIIYQMNLVDTLEYHVKRIMTHIMKDFIMGCVTVSSDKDERYIRSVISSGVTLPIHPLKRDTLESILKIDDLSDALKFRLVEKTLYNVGFFNRAINT